jgi:hypothetical protein
MNETQLRNFALTNALNHYLCDVPENNHPEEVLEMLSEGDDSLLVWEPFEHHPKSVIADLVDDLAHSLKHQYDYIITNSKKEN